MSPGATYELVYSGSNGFVDGGMPVGVGSFTTGNGVDDTTPNTPVVSSVSVGPRHACGYEPPEACCVPVPLLTATIAVAPANEPKFYSLREGDTFVAVDLPSLESGILACDQYPEFAYDSGPGRLPTWWMQGALHELVLTSRDLAGHESPPVYVTLAGLCSVGDHGTGPLHPGGPATDGGGGCRVSHRRSPGSALWVLAALLMLWGTLARRRS